MPTPTIEELLALAAALTRAEQYELLNKLHDAIYHPVYQPLPK